MGLNNKDSIQLREQLKNDFDSLKKTIAFHKNKSTYYLPLNVSPTVRSFVGDNLLHLKNYKIEAKIEAKI